MDTDQTKLQRMAEATGRSSSHLMERIYLGALVGAVYSAYSAKRLERLVHFIEVRRIHTFLKNRL